MDQETLDKVRKAQNSFYYFVVNIFSRSESLFPDGFVNGKHVKSVCDQLQNNPKTARVSARDHFKSTAFYGHFMWMLFKGWDQNIEAHYFSFQHQMARYHITKIKNAIKTNPFFSQIIDKKKAADGVLKYTWDGEHFTTLQPRGLLEFKRGIHAPLIYLDDPFQDPSNKMVITVINKVNTIFKAQILDMVQDQIHVCGTPQTNQDFFFDDNVMSEFNVTIKPAIVNELNKEVLWPEWMSFDALMQKKKEKGEKLFNQEYLCRPTYAEEAFINRDELFALVDVALPNRSIHKAYEMGDNVETVIAGFDIGKKSHPSHLTVFEIVDGKRRQLHQFFMDNWPYVKQIEYLKKAIDTFKIDSLWYDDTRSEFEGFSEQGILPPQMIPVVFSVKSKHAMAAQLDTGITNKNVSFLNSPRFLEQMLLVTNDLQAIETPEGHGDSFWSVALTFMHEGAPQPTLTIL